MIYIIIMKSSHLRSFDLNLLVALEALLAERNVSRAAESVGVTQSAMSHMLARLRAAFGDPLFVRVPGGIRPTPRAEAIARPLAAVLADLRQITAPPTAFEPSAARRVFQVVTDDYLERILLPKFLAHLWQQAPGIDVDIATVSNHPADDLISGRADLIISVAGVLGSLPGAFAQKLFDERFVCAIRKGHPLAAKPLTAAQFAGLFHVLVAPRGRAGSIVDKVLAKQGRRRRVAVTVPHFLAAPDIVRATDAVVTLGARLAKALSQGLVLVPPPVPLPGFTVVMYWHERNNADPAHQWFRAQLAHVARRI